LNRISDRRQTEEIAAARRYCLRQCRRFGQTCRHLALATPPYLDEGPYQRQRQGPEQHPPKADVGRRAARVQEPDPLLEQWISRHQQKHENAAESHRNEPHGKPGLQRRQVECTDGITKESEGADQVKVTQRGGTFAEMMLIAMGRQQQADPQRQHHEDQGCSVEFFNGGDQACQQKRACQRHLLLIHGRDVG
jgi:hypothetical protein